MSDAIRIKCWSCHEGMTLFEHEQADGMCPCCGVEVALDEYLTAAMQENLQLKAEAQALREEVAALRARVVVIPEGYALAPVELTREMWAAINKEDDKAYAGGCDHGAQFDWLWDAALDAAPRLNGKVVSEGLLRRVCLEAPAVQDMHEQSSWELAHFKAVYELRDLLDEGKES